MHVGIFIPHLHGGGAEFVTRQWIDELAATGHVVTVYVYDRDQPTVALPDGVTVHHFVPIGGALRRVQLPFWLRSKVRRTAPDVVLSLMTYSNVVAIVAMTVLGRSLAPIVVSERNMPSLETRGGRLRARIVVRLGHLLYARAAGVVAISHPVAGELVSAFRVAADRLYVVPNPVVSTLNDTAPRPSADRSPLHLVFVGRFVEQKRPNLFLSVMEELASSGVSIRATMIGEGPLRAPAERTAVEHGLAVTFLGWREPWWEAARDIDCLLLTAGFEGFGNVLVEAAVAGIPVVASSRALGVADAVIPGITGELAVTDSVRAYADAVLRAATITVGAAGTMAGWFERFSPSSSTAMLVAALDGALEPSAKR